MNPSTLCQIWIKGHLNAEWSGWFGGLSLENQPDGGAVLTGEVSDQSERHGILARIRD